MFCFSPPPTLIFKRIFTSPPSSRCRLLAREGDCCALPVFCARCLVGQLKVARRASSTSFSC
ncbi:hypothetical protein HCDSEM_165 [Candidatus Hodgkinia cicadicola Dsem]|nr:hypothetical protein HCDSEM_165 [Candidatus Hodgkinia cicadicola Dsem]